eukprot:1412431-Prymnesium_polylepis.1
MLGDSSETFGIFTERDYLKLRAMGTVDVRQAPVSEFMTPAGDLVWAEADYPALDALALMSNEGFRHLPIAEATGQSASLAPPKLIAVLSMREIMSFFAKGPTA